MLPNHEVESKMILRYIVLRFVPLLALGCIVAGCGTLTPDVGLESTQVPTETPLPTRTPAPSPTRKPIQLVVLHTNDNWGETEPCG
jgi:hypothetical protein